MALDILVTNSHGETGKSIPLYIEDYDYIMEKIDAHSRFYFIKKNLSDYYGDSEIYLDDLNVLKKEVFLFEKEFESFYSQSIAEFMSAFLNIIDYAIENKRTIRFIGD